MIKTRLSMWGQSKVQNGAKCFFASLGLFWEGLKNLQIGVLQYGK